MDLHAFTVGIKMHKKNNNYLSFSDNGVTINADQIFKKKNFAKKHEKIKKLYDYVIKKKHKIYLCKDFLINNNDLKANYKDAKKFLSIKLIKTINSPIKLQVPGVPILAKQKINR